MSDSHVVRLYNRVKHKKEGDKVAVVIARHLAEATWHILKTRQHYREPKYVSSRCFDRDHVSFAHEQGRKGHATKESEL